MKKGKKQSAFVSKKAQSVFFLVELILLAGVVIILITAASKFVSLDSKYLEFDSYNLALFLERVPSIEGNFKYEVDFNGSVSVDITPNKVFLDRPKYKDKRFVEQYNNPRQYQFDVSFEDVDSLYFYKIGDDVYIRKDVDSTLENRLSMKKIPNLDSHSIISLSDGRGTSALDIDSINIVYSYFLEDDSKTVSIMYNKKGKYYAYEYYNMIFKKNFNTRLDGILLSPLQDYSLLESELSTEDLDLVPFFVIVTGKREVEALLDEI